VVYLFLDAQIMRVKKSMNSQTAFKFPTPYINQERLC
jgi:hypothetical protein